MARPHLSIRIDFPSGDRIGPGKIALLEAIRSTGSISGAARSLGMSYRRGRLFVEEGNDAPREPPGPARARRGPPGGRGPPPPPHAPPPPKKAKTNPRN